MVTNRGGIPITTKRIAMHKSIAMTDGSVTLVAFSLSEYMLTSYLPYSAVTPVRSTEKLISVSGSFMRDGQTLPLTLQRKLSQDEISRAVSRINLLNQFFSDVGRRLEHGVETLIPLFDGLQAGFRKVDYATTATVFVFEQDGARCELVSGSPAEMTDLRDGFGNILAH